jgi:hypothetical protein
MNSSVSIADKKALFRRIIGRQLAIYAAPLNGLTNTDQDACILSGARKFMGNPVKSECSKEFALPASNEGTFRNSVLTNHVKLVAFLDTIRDLNSDVATATAMRLKTVFRDHSDKDKKEVSPIASSTNKTSFTSQMIAQDNEAESSTGKRRTSFRLREYLYKCFDPHTSWMAKIQDLEVLARRVLVKKCADEASKAIKNNPIFANVDAPLYPTTSDLCGLKPEELKSRYKNPEHYPDFFNAAGNLSQDECRMLAMRHNSLMEMSMTGNRRCQESLNGKREDTTQTQHQTSSSTTKQ